MHGKISLAGFFYHVGAIYAGSRSRSSRPVWYNGFPSKPAELYAETGAGYETRKVEV